MPRHEEPTIISRGHFIFGIVCGGLLQLANVQCDGDGQTVRTNHSMDDKGEAGCGKHGRAGLGAAGATGGGNDGRACRRRGDRAWTGHTTLKGHIDADDVAVLRVYRASDLNMILTLHRGSPDRLDIPLDPGTTDIDIVKDKGQMADVPHAAPAQ